MPDNSPLESPLLGHLRPGDTFFGATWRISGCTLRQGTKGHYVFCTLADATGERVAKAWNFAPEGFDAINESHFVRAAGRVDSAPAYLGQIILSALEPVAAPDDLTRFEMPLCGDHRGHAARFNDLIRGVRHPHLLALLKEVFRHDGEIWPCFSHAPAATHMHHNYRGGLLEHSGEVALLCERLAGALPHLDRDLLLSAALLHDIGKIEEMECDFSSGKIDYTHAGRLVGHIVLGAALVAGAAERIEGFPTRLKHELMHLILSHHGEPEYGAAKRPMCAEALILSQCDNLSAKIAMCEQKADAEGDFASTGGWHNLPFAPQKLIYTGKMREMREGVE